MIQFGEHPRFVAEVLHDSGDAEKAPHTSRADFSSIRQRPGIWLIGSGVTLLPGEMEGIVGSDGGKLQETTKRLTTHRAARLQRGALQMRITREG